MDRDDANINHFRSRSRQPKILAAEPIASAAMAQGPVNIYIVHDGGFGTVADQIDNNRFRHMGTSPHISQYSASCSRRLGHTCMNTGFEY